jgi:hypothetical protein
LGISLGNSDGDDVILKGATDSTLIGNNSNRLLVDAAFATPPTVEAIEFPTFYLLAPSVAIGNNKSMISLVNLAGSAVKIKIREIYLINEQNAAITGVVASFSLLRMTGHSGGTLLTPSSHDSTDVISGSFSARTGSTVAGEVAAPLRQAKWATDEWGVGTLDQEGFDHGVQQTIPLYECRNKMKPITLNAGEGLTLKQTVNSTAGAFSVAILFTQE